MKTLLQSLRMLVVLTVLTGFVYPLAVTGLARLAFREQAGGSIVMRNGVPTGSRLLAQRFDDPCYFWPRPSAADYATVPSGASNKGPTSADLAKAIAERRERYGNETPAELLTASGSGLDPHLSPEAALWQADRIAQARGLPAPAVRDLIARLTEDSQFGILGEPRVNVLALNLALDATTQAPDK